jgi:putative hydrolase of the HAD superfamily
MELETAQIKLESLIQSYEGTLQWYCLDHWSDLTAMDITTLKQEIQHKILVRPHAEAFLIALKQQKKKTVLATNCHRKALDLKLKISKIDRWLDIIISSHDYQQPKEVQAFWHNLAQQEHIDPERTLFIDDSIPVLRSAQTFGIRHLVCINKPDSQKPIKKSKEFIDIVDFDEIMPHTK